MTTLNKRRPKGLGEKLTASDVLIIRGSDLTQQELTHKFGVSQATISLIRAGKRWQGVV